MARRLLACRAGAERPGRVEGEKKEKEGGKREKKKKKGVPSQLFFLK